MYIQAKCGKVFNIPYLLATHCSALVNLSQSKLNSLLNYCTSHYRIFLAFGDAKGQPVSLPIEEKYLKFIFKYAQLFKNQKPYISPGQNKLAVKNFDTYLHGKLILSLSLEDTVHLFHAAHYLQFERLEDDLCRGYMFRLSLFVNPPKKIEYRWTKKF